MDTLVIAPSVCLISIQDNVANAVCQSRGPCLHHHRRHDVNYLRSLLLVESRRYVSRVARSCDQTQTTVVSGNVQTLVVPLDGRPQPLQSVYVKIAEVERIASVSRRASRHAVPTPTAPHPFFSRMHHRRLCLFDPSTMFASQCIRVHHPCSSRLRYPTYCLVPS